jgi:hypothetical protein
MTAFDPKRTLALRPGLTPALVLGKLRLACLFRCTTPLRLDIRAEGDEVHASSFSTQY